MNPYFDEVEHRIIPVSIRTRPEGRVNPAPAVLVTLGQLVSIRTRPEGRVNRYVCQECGAEITVSIRTRPEGRVNH